MLSTFAQYSALGLLLLRLAIAFIFAYHGYPKLKKPVQMAAGLGWPVNAIRILGTFEILGALGVTLAFHTQLAALIFALVMVGAIYYKITRWHVPFWAHDNTGWEFDLILLAVAIFFLTNPM